MFHVRIEIPGLPTMWAASAPTDTILTRFRSYARKYRGSLNADLAAGQFERMLTVLGFNQFDVFVEAM